MGEHLSKVRELLEPQKLWKQYANTIPNLGMVTAYRCIWAWENAQKALPPAAVRVMAREGYKIIARGAQGTGKKPVAPFAPGYAEAVKAVTKENGPVPDNEVEAGKWLKLVVETKRKLGRKHGPKDAQKYFSVERQARGIATRMIRIMSRLSDRKREQFVRRVMELVMEKKRPVKESAASAA